jgi:hypothetical protein
MLMMVNKDLMTERAKCTRISIMGNAAVKCHVQDIPRNANGAMMIGQ